MLTVVIGHLTVLRSPGKGETPMYERFTDRARKVMQLANQEAQRFNHEYIGTEHILLGLVQEGSGVAANVLKNLDVDHRKVREAIEKVVQTGPGGDEVALSRLPHTPRAKKVIEFSVDEARFLGHQYVGTEHLLLGLLREREGVAAQVLMNLGLKLDDVREEVLNLLGRVPRSDVGTGDAAARTPDRRERSRADRITVLNALGSHLGDLVRQGKVPRLVGRHAELATLVEILLCRSRNTALVLGEPGVGKATLVAGLCRDVIDGRVPDGLRDRPVLALPVSRLWADARDWSHLLNRTRALFDELRRERKAVLYLPDAIASMAHSAGNTAAQRVHAELMLALEDGQVPVILSGTPAEYRRCLRRYRSLEGLVQPVHLRPATVEETVAVLRGIRDRYERHHGVTITDDALTAAAEWADRQLPGALPGKAVRLVDRAAARGRVRAGTGSPDLVARVRDLEARIDRLNREKEDLVAGHDFQRAAEKRNEADAAKRERDEVLAQQQTQSAVTAMVDPALVAEVARDLAAERSPSGPAAA